MIAISPKRVAKYLVSVALVFDALSFLVQLPQYLLGYSLPQKIVEFFNVGGEYNPQAWYSSLLLALCALLLWLISLSEEEQFARQTRYWQALSFIFIYLALDEMLLFHERVGELLGQHIHTSGIFRYAWVVLAIPLCLAIGIIFLRFILLLPKKIRRLFLISGGLYIGSALLLELIEGYAASIYGEKSLADFLLVAIEELVEKLSLILFIYTLLHYLEKYGKPFYLKD